MSPEYDAVPNRLRVRAQEILIRVDESTLRSEPIAIALHEETLDLLEIIAELAACTRVLGAGVGKLVTPDGFFTRWNEAECRAQRVLAKQIKESP